MVSENLWNKTAARQEISAFSEDYRAFLTACKTERECVSYMPDRLQAGGYQKLTDVIRENGALASGDKVYADMMGKAKVRLDHLLSKEKERGFLKGWI